MNAISVAVHSVYAWLRALIFEVNKDEIPTHSDAKKNTLERLNAFIDASIQQHRRLYQQQRQEDQEVFPFVAAEAAIFAQQLHAKMADDIVDCLGVIPDRGTDDPYVLHVTLHCSAWMFLWKAADFAKLHKYNLHVVIGEKLAARPENVNEVLLQCIEEVIADFDKTVTVYTEPLANQFAMHMNSKFKDAALGYSYGTKRNADDEHVVFLGVYENADWDTWAAVDFSKLQSKKLHVEMDFSLCYVEEQ